MGAKNRVSSLRLPHQCRVLSVKREQRTDIGLALAIWVEVRWKEMACSGPLLFFIPGSFPPTMPYVLAMPLYCMRIFNTNCSLSICNCTNLTNSLSTCFLNLYFFSVLIIAEICLGREFNKVCSSSCRMQIATACFLGNDCLSSYVAASVLCLFCVCGCAFCPAIWAEESNSQAETHSLIVPTWM